MSIVSLCYLVSRFLPCGGLYCHPFSNEGLDGTSETPTNSKIFSVVRSSLRVKSRITLRFTIDSVSRV
jgi:hypothetical protein